MLKKLREWRRPPPMVAAVPDGLRVYAIGDVHGRLDLLDTLIDMIEADNQSRPVAESQVIFLGDLIDRGPDSAHVVDRALALRRATPNTRFVKGNHEEMLLKLLGGDLANFGAYMLHGGHETILSYGITEDDVRMLDEESLATALRRAIPRHHVEFLTSFEDLIEIGDYAFVHAGVRPGIDLSAQKPSDTRWIRQDFLDHTAPFGRVIVHGHSIAREIEWRANRIGIDTGAYASGKLTALGLEGDTRWSLST